MDIKRAAQQFIRSKEAQGLRPKSLVFYRWAIQRIEHAGPAVPESSSQLEDIMAEARANLGPESLHDLYRAIRTFYAYLVQRGHLVANPAIQLRPPQRPPRRPKTLTDAQVHQLLAAGCRTRRDRLMVLLPLDTGVRVGELACLTKDAISLDTITVQGKRGEREVPVSPTIATDLLTLGSESHPWVSRQGRPLTFYGVQIAYARIFAMARVQGSPHRLRHTFALSYVVNGGDPFSLQQILGHRDIQTTMVYVYMDTSRTVAAHHRYTPIKNYVKEEA